METTDKLTKKRSFYRTRMTVWGVLLLACLQFGLPTIATADERQRLAVVGVDNLSDEEELSKLLIVQGVAHLIAQELYDTGQYIPVEDNPEIADRVAELLQLSSQGTAAVTLASKYKNAELGSDTLAFATIKRFSKSRNRSFLGPFSSAKVNVELELEVSLQAGGADPISATGIGTGVTKSRGILFQVREDKVHFDKTSVGKAMQDAVRQAVAGLMESRKENI